MWTLHTDSGNSVYGGQSAKNIYLGETRIVTKLNSGTNPTYQEEYYKQYFYHSDHLGSASLISDYKGDEYQRIEYTPYGETWVEKSANTGLEFLPYKFTAKELDEETGLYYYGARYLDSKYSRWISTDPALGEYIPKAPINEEAKRYNQNLPGLGGVFNHINGSLYHYAGNNPVRYIDPDGNETYDSDITEEQYNKSHFLQQEMSWKEVQAFFNENPKGVLHRPEDQFGFMKLKSKKDIVDINDGSMLMLDILLIGRGLISVGKVISGNIGNSIAKNYLSKNLRHHILSRHTLSGLRNQASRCPKEYLVNLTKKTIFNPKWSDRKVLNASMKALNEAIKNGVTNGAYSTTVYGETVEVIMSNGVPQTIYGKIPLTLEMLK